ncbi:MAG: hypothetical protein H6Q65_2211 [Firmicutes bacterium]|nr:hypothetical protein [Bacillota bacterium]
MKKSIAWACAVLFICTVVFFGAVCSAKEAVGDGAYNDKSEIIQQNDLKKQCLAATITAINLEINRHQRWLDYRIQQGDQNAAEELRKSIVVLKSDLEKYSVMKPDDYQLPEKRENIGWTGDKPGIDSLLYVDNMSKNGPWYHMVGIKGGNYSALSSKERYHVVFYPVYQRSYWGMDSSYVYVADFGQQQQGKRITGEVYKHQYAFPLDDKTKCDSYQIFLLKDLQPGTKAKQILNAKKSTFAINLSEEQMQEYFYIEFISSVGSKTLKISEITGDPIEIILEPEVFIKKPAIYLYPEEKSKIVITHSFKGKILSTYPTYGDNWTVIADPDGTLLNWKDNRTYQYLFWDGFYSFPQEHYQYQSGFYVEKKDYVLFLQDKLAHIGLNEREINDFIVYWLPSMSKYSNCFVHFRINDNIDGSSILTVSPAPKTTIRVFMEFAGIEDMPRTGKLPEQLLPAFVRQGFVLVEWGGAELGSSKIE